MRWYSEKTRSSALNFLVSASQFVSVWQTFTSNELITLPLAGSNYSLSIDWGDGSVKQNYSSSLVSHVFSVAGNYSVSIHGTLTGFRFNSQGNALNLFNIISWGGFTFDHTSTSAFAGCANLRISAFNQPVFSPGTTLDYLFENCTSLNSALIWDVANVVSLVGMFKNATSFNQPLVLLNTGGITNMSEMFSGAILFNQALSLNTSSVADMSGMFWNASMFNQPIQFDTSRVQSMANMFNGAQSFNQPINFSTYLVTNMRGMFASASRLNKPVQLTKTSNVRDMSRMFYDAIYFDQAMDLDTRNVQTMAQMFCGARRLNQPINLSTDNVSDMQSMFQLTHSFNSPITISSTRQVTNMRAMFYGAQVFDQSLNNFDTSSVTDMTEMFYGATQFNQPLTFNTSSVRSMRGMFQTSAYNMPLNFDTKNVISMASMFANNAVFNQPLAFDTANVTDMSGMFASAFRFNSSLNFTSTARVTSMYSMFGAATRFNQPIDFDTRSVANLGYMFGASAFNRPLFLNTTNVQSMNYMFHTARYFNQPLTFDTSNVQEMDYMFAFAHSYTYPIHFNTSRVRSMNFMFSIATSFNQPLSFDTSNVVSMQGMFNGALSYNQTLHFDTKNVVNMANMFSGAFGFGAPLQFSSTAKVQTMANMFENAYLFRYNLASWETDATTSCEGFCARCGLPSFATCTPCARRWTTDEGWSMCNCPVNTTCVEPPLHTDLCSSARFGEGLRGQCVTQASISPSPAVVVSPLVNITQIALMLSEGVFTFSLPTLPSALGLLQPRDCYQSQLSCEWLDPITKTFQASGCEVVALNVDLNPGVTGTQCLCYRLGLFAVILRSERHPRLCEQNPMDYVLMSVFSVLIVAILSSAYKQMSQKSLVLIHGVLLTIVVLRVALLAAKSQISPLGLMFISLFPAAFSLSLFVYLLIHWQALFAMTVHPFIKCRIFFISASVCSFLTVVASVILGTESATVASCLLSVFTGGVCLLTLGSGRALSRTSPDYAAQNANLRSRTTYRVVILISTVGVGLCLTLGSCTWTATIQTFLRSPNPTTPPIVAALFLEWMGLCMTAILCAFGRDKIQGGARIELENIQ